MNILWGDLRGIDNSRRSDLRCCCDGVRALTAAVGAAALCNGQMRVCVCVCLFFVGLHLCGDLTPLTFGDCAVLTVLCALPAVRTRRAVAFVQEACAVCMHLVLCLCVASYAWERCEQSPCNSARLLHCAVCLHACHFSLCGLQFTFGHVLWRGLGFGQRAGSERMLGFGWADLKSDIWGEQYSSWSSALCVYETAAAASCVVSMRAVCCVLHSAAAVQGCPCSECCLQVGLCSTDWLISSRCQTCRNDMGLLYISDVTV
jgi:hypothetical protein